jgi:hypothetical protein
MAVKSKTDFEIDKRVAKIQGWSWDDSSIYNEHHESRYARHEGGRDRLRDVLPLYSSDMAAAWQVVEKLADDGYCPGLIFDDNGHWSLSLDGSQNVPTKEGEQDIWTNFYVEADAWFDDAALAICVTVLKVYDSDGEAIHGEKGD